jgi:hypothetical protein
MLNTVLKAIQQSQGPIRIQVLSRKLNIDAAVLEGMLDFWVHKGRIQREVLDYTGCDPSTCPDGCKLCSIRAAKRK